MPIERKFSSLKARITGFVFVASLGSGAILVLFVGAHQESGSAFRWTTYAAAVLVAAVLWLAIAAYVGRALRPQARLVDGIRRMTASGGDLQPLPAAGFSEIDPLVDSFNALVERRRQTEAALLRSEARLAHAELVSKTGHWELHLDSMTIAASAGAVQIYGAANATDYFPAIQKATLPEYRERLDRAFDGLLNRDEAYDESFRIRALDSGEIKDLRIIATFDRANGVVFGVVQDLSERLAFERALERAEARRRIFLEQTHEGVAVLASDGRLLEWNPAFARMLGYEPDELAGLTVFDWDAGLPRDELEHILATRFDSLRIETRHRRKDGTVYACEVSTAHVEWSGEEFAFCLCRDISARQRAEEARRLAATVFSHAKEAIMVTDAHGAILDVNPTFSEITGYTRDEVVGQNPRLLRSGRHDTAFYARLWDALGANGHWSGEIWNRRKDGTVFPEMLVINSVRDENGVVQQYVALFSDITEQKDQQFKLERLAHHDALTGLPNRSLLADRLGRAMRLAARQGRRIVVCYLDLDGFKEVNDRYGHAVGDQLLQALADRMRRTLRDSDTLARIGGDEFVALLHDPAEQPTSYASVERLIAEVARPVQINDDEIRVSASLGMTYYPQAQAVDAEQLLRQADQAMYRAKQGGKNRYCVFAADATPPAPRAA